MHQLIPARQGRSGQDLIFALNAEASGRARKGEAIVNATLGALMNDDGTLAVLPTVTRTLAQVPPAEWAAYAPITGAPGFLDAVVDDTFSTAPGLARSATGAATPGGTGALGLALSNYLEPGQALLTSSLYWGPYLTLCEEHERRLDTFRMFDERGRLDLAALEAGLEAHLASQGRALLFLNDPCHNPTGYSLLPEEWAALAALLGRHAGRPVTLLVDMAYWLYGSASPRAFLSALEPLVGQVGLLFAWSASKSYTHYGLRVGALLACPGAEDRAATEAALSFSCRGSWSNCNRGGMWAVTRLLRDAALTAQVDLERAALQALLRSRVEAFNEQARGRGLRYPRYEGGFFVTVFHPEAEAQAAVMRERGVYVVPQKGGLRVALCSVAVRDVPRLVEALAG
jgi:aromatic-amino-acid transaminase